MNKVELIGRLTNDPVLRYTTQNTPVASYSVAVNTGYGEKKETLFINVVTWGKSGEFVSQYIKKGQTIALIGRLKNNSYEDEKGNKYNSIVVVTEDVESVGNKSSENKVEELKEETPKQEEVKEQNIFELEESDLPF